MFNGHRKRVVTFKSEINRLQWHSPFQGSFISADTNQIYICAKKKEKSYRFEDLCKLFVPGLSHTGDVRSPSLPHTPVLSGNIFPQTLALCGFLTASLVNEARTMSCRERKGEAEEWPWARGRVSKRRHITKNLACHFWSGAWKGQLWKLGPTLAVAMVLT